MSNIVQEVCKELNINQSELAKKLDVTTSAVAQWNSKEIPKMAKKAMEYLLKSYKQEQQLKTIKEFQKVLQDLNKS